MIKRIQLIRNIGLFGSFSGSATTPFDNLTLIYAENGRGKTTLSGIFRSLASGDPIPIIERKRLSAQDAPHVVIECDETTGTAVFQNAAWNQVYSNIRIFDDCFIHENVHAGLEVTSDQRQNLHQLIIGREGVALARRVEELTTEITRLQSELRNRAGAITSDIRGPFTVDNFCAVTQIEDIDNAIEQAQNSLTALQQAEKVRTTQEFEPFEPPIVNLDNIRNILSRTLSNIDSEANETVQAHLQSLGENAETWVAQGMDILANNKQTVQSCPFCNQPLSELKLVDHYRAYFSEAYAQHKTNIISQIQDTMRILGEDSFVRFNRFVTQQKERYDFWSQFMSLVSFEIDMEALTSSWQKLREQIQRLLQMKLDSPLEEVNFDEVATNALEEYETLQGTSRILSRELLHANEEIARLKEVAASGSLPAATTDLQQLRAIKSRFTTDVNTLCNGYLEIKTQKEQAETQKVQAREALDNHRQEMFPRYQGAINEYLRKFNAGFRIVEVQAINPRGAQSSNYQIEIDNSRIQLTQQNPEDPAFKNTLSAGDRNTLALAFYFASLDQESALNSIVSIIDDPVSSLDDGRTMTTAQEIRELSSRVAQVILLSHSKKILCMVWQRSDRQNRSALSVIPHPDGSTIELWNVLEESITEYDRLHELLRRYESGTEREFREVAKGLRYVLEGYLRVVCTEYFPPGTLIGQLITRARDLAERGNPILSEPSISELDAITEYANKFHHDTNPSWDVVMSNINEHEIKGFVRRVLAFTKI